MKTKDKVIFVKSKEFIDYTSGEITHEEREIHKMQDTEPSYIKLYIDCLLTFNEVSKSLNPILINFLKHMSYASMEDENGGQVIYVNAQMKRNIAKTHKISFKRIEQAITEFVKARIFKRIAVGTYQINPNMFGKGEWKNIKYIRANFDFNKRTIEAEITKAEEIKLTN